MIVAKQPNLLQRLLHRAPHKRKGQSLILVALSLLMIFAILALTLNVQQLVNSRADVQTAADSAALAGANVQAQAKELIKTFEILQFLRDEIVALIQSAAIVVRDIGYGFIAVGIGLDAIPPCFCAGDWAFPIADAIENIAQIIQNVADEVDSLTSGFKPVLQGFEKATALVGPFIAMYNAYEYGQANGADFTIPLAMPIGVPGQIGSGYQGQKLPDDSTYAAKIKADQADIDNINNNIIPGLETNYWVTEKTVDVLSIKIDGTQQLTDGQGAAHGYLVAQEALVQPQQPQPPSTDATPLCQENPSKIPCPQITEAIQASQAQLAAGSTDTQTVQAAQQAFDAAGCKDNPTPTPAPGPAPNCGDLQTAIDNAQHVYNQDVATRDAAMQQADGYQSQINDAKTQRDNDQTDITNNQNTIEQNRENANAVDAGDLRRHDVSMGIPGLEGVMVIVVKKGPTPLLNFGGSDPGQTWASAFGFTVSSSEPLYSHSSDTSLFTQANGSTGGGVLGALGGVFGWFVDALTKLAQADANGVDSVRAALNGLCSGAICDFVIGEIEGLPIFQVEAPDMHDVRPRLIKVDAGFMSSAARVDGSDPYAVANELSDALHTADTLINTWHAAASATGLDAPATIPITGTFGQFDPSNPDSFF